MKIGLQPLKKVAVDKERKNNKKQEDSIPVKNRQHK